MIKDSLKPNGKKIFLAVIILLLLMLCWDEYSFGIFEDNMVILRIFLGIVAAVFITMLTVYIKTELSIKTKIAACWLMGLGIIGITLCVIIYKVAAIEGGWSLYAASFIILFLLVVSFIIFLLGLLLFKRKRWVWWLDFVILTFVTLYFIIYFILSLQDMSLESMSILSFCLFIAAFLIPLVLLLIDHKNFWRITS
jgi:hypothetical protein